MSTEEKTVVTNEWEARNYLLEHINGYGLTAFTIDQTDNGEPRFALVNPDEGGVWIITVTPAELVASGEVAPREASDEHA